MIDLLKIKSVSPVLIFLWPTRKHFQQLIVPLYLPARAEPGQRLCSCSTGGTRLQLASEKSRRKLPSVLATFVVFNPVLEFQTKVKILLSDVIKKTLVRVVFRFLHTHARVRERERACVFSQCVRVCFCWDERVALKCVLCVGVCVRETKIWSAKVCYACVREFVCISRRNLFCLGLCARECEKELEQPLPQASSTYKKTNKKKENTQKSEHIWKEELKSVVITRN